MSVRARRHAGPESPGGRGSTATARGPRIAPQGYGCTARCHGHRASAADRPIGPWMRGQKHAAIRAASSERPYLARRHTWPTIARLDGSCARRHAGPGSPGGTRLHTRRHAGSASPRRGVCSSSQGRWYSAPGMGNLNTPIAPAGDGGDDAEHILSDPAGHRFLHRRACASMIKPTIQGRLYEYIGGIVLVEKGSLLAAGGTPDHLHMLYNGERTRRSRISCAMSRADHRRVSRQDLPRVPKRSPGRRGTASSVSKSQEAAEGVHRRPGGASSHLAISG